MAKETIKGLTVKIGGDTTELGKALEGVNKKSRDLSSELGSINRLLKFDPTNTDLLAQKQKVLAEAIETTQEKLETLHEAEKQAQRQLANGDITEAQYRALQREIAATEQKLQSYERAAKTTAEAVEHLGDKVDESAEDLKDQEKKAEAAEEALDDMGSTAASVAKTGLGLLAAAATAVVGALVAAAEESREYRREMGKLDTAFRDANHSAADAKETYEELQGVLGETDQAVEASNHLAELCETEEELHEWTDILTGVYAKFGDSLPIESLAEAANESAKKTGDVVGALADAISWAADEGETFGVKLKRATKQNEEWNKKVQEATNAEDYFALALEDCSTEQERQQLITKTLTKYYKSAATQYKKTNKEVIESNKATEKWNQSMAKIGKTVDPLITDVKEFGAELLSNAEQPIKEISKFITDKLIPALKNISSWVRSNKAEITGVITALTVGYVGYKASVLAAELATKGVTAASLAAAAAQKALNLVMNANPVGLLITAFASLAAGMTAYYLSTEEAKAGVDTLTDAEKELIQASTEAAEAFRDQQKATTEQESGILTQMGYIENLAGELDSLVRANGRVDEANRQRVSYILNEMNEALGTEYELVDGEIQRYDELKQSIDSVIRAKTANSLLEANNADYVAAMEAEGQAWEALQLAQQDYDAQLQHTEEVKQQYADKLAEIDAQLAEASGKADTRLSQSTALQKAKIEELIQAEEDALAEKKEAYDQAATDYETYENTIQTYREAEEAAFTGNTQKAIELLTEKGQAHSVYSDKVDDETAKVLDALKREAVNAGIEARRTKDNFEKGVDGYTKEMVDEAQKGYEDALAEFETAYADAEGVGEDLAEGASAGIDNKAANMVARARAMVVNAIAAMRAAADSNSPSKETMSLGEDMGEGAQIGIDNSTKDVANAARRQTEAVLDAYRDEAQSGQQIFRGVAEQQAARQAKQAQAASAGNAGVLGEILDAIKAGQVLAIDKNKLVGATAKAYDRELGFQRALVERGAV